MSKAKVINAVKEQWLQDDFIDVFLQAAALHAPSKRIAKLDFYSRVVKTGLRALCHDRKGFDEACYEHNLAEFRTLVEL